jgi:hypothetical protein
MLGKRHDFGCFFLSQLYYRPITRQRVSCINSRKTEKQQYLPHV